MMGLGLSYAAQSSFHSLLGKSHRIRVTVEIMTLSHVRLSDVSTLFLDGTITIDSSAAVTRAATVSFFDPLHKMALDSESPADGALYMDRMLAIYLTVMNPDYSGAVTIPVFTGPIIKIDRDASTVQVECQGKEIIGLNPVWTPKTYPAGANKVAMIRDIMTVMTGENKFSLPSGTTNKTTVATALSNESKPWEVVKQIASSMGYQLFYDGRGTLIMRPWPTRTAWTFHDQNGGTLISKPQVGFDGSNLINSVIIKGVATKGKQKIPFVFKKFAPSTHPLSPGALGRNGVRRFFTTTIDDPNINTTAEATAVADATIAKGLLTPVEVAFDALPIPHLEEADVYTLKTSEYTTTASFTKGTIPLAASGKMTVGYLKNTPANKARIRRLRP